MIHTSHSIEETQKVAQVFVSYLSSLPTSKQNALVIGFSGDLGSGKTAFTKCVAKLLGITEHVTSPTFVIQKRYSIKHQNFPFKTLIHIDAYRLENARELEVLDFKRDLEDPTNVILIEWPEKVIEILPTSSPIIRFTFISPHVRTIEFPDMMTI